MKNNNNKNDNYDNYDNFLDTRTNFSEKKDNKKDDILGSIERNIDDNKDKFEKIYEEKKSEIDRRTFQKLSESSKLSLLSLI